LADLGLKLTSEFLIFVLSKSVRVDDTSGKKFLGDSQFKIILPGT
jgi:hypothetical protein